MRYLLFLILLPVFYGCNERRSSVITGMEGKRIPSFDLLLMDSVTRFNTDNIPAGEPFVFFFISPYCPYCKAQTADIITNLKSLKGLHFYILSSLPFKPLSAFYNQYKLDQYKNILMGYDYTSYFEKYYQVTNVPYIAIFNKEKVLKRALKGKTSTNLIRDIAFE